MSARLGVQLVTYHNGFEQLLRTLRGVEATVAKARAAQLVGDVTVRMGDCSEREWYSADELEQFAAAVPSASFSYRYFDANLGSGGGSNALAEGVDEDLTWVLNPDTYPAPSCLTELIAALAPDDVGVAEGRQIPLEHPKAYDPVTGDTSWGSGCCLLFKRAAFDLVGGFDPHFFPMYCDDVDVSWRLRLAGRRVVHAPRGGVPRQALRRRRRSRGVRVRPVLGRTGTHVPRLPLRPCRPRRRTVGMDRPRRVGRHRCPTSGGGRVPRAAGAR